jgi:hypothetical protein
MYLIKNYIHLQTYSEPKNMNETTNTIDTVKTTTSSYYLARFYGSAHCTMQVKVLHHLACIELTVETVDLDRDGKTSSRCIKYLIDERLTLKYF